MSEETKKTSDTCNGCIHYWPLYNDICKKCEGRDFYESKEGEKDAKE